MLRDLPLVVLPHVDKSVAGLDLRTVFPHGEFVNACILGPVAADKDVTIVDDTLGLLQQEVIKVVNNQSWCSPWDVGDSRQ